MYNAVFSHIILNKQLLKYIYIKSQIMVDVTILHNQGLEHVPWMHRSLKAYCATLLTPLSFRRSHFHRLMSPRPYTTQEIQAVKGGTCGQEYSPVILPKCQLPRYI
jgi:hypothetical protein